MVECYCCGDNTENPRNAWCAFCTISYKGDMIWHCVEHVKDIEVRLTV